MLLLILLRRQFFDRVLGREHEHGAREWENKWEAENYLGKRDGSFMKRTMFMTMLVIFMCCILFDTDTPALAAAKGPTLYTNKWTVEPGEEFALSWEEPDFDGSLTLWKCTDGDEYYEMVADVPKISKGYRVNLDQEGPWHLCLSGTRGGESLLGDEIVIDVYEGSGKKAPHAGDPMLYSNKTSVSAGEHFSLSWYEDQADGELVLWRRMENTEYEYVDTVPKSSVGYDTSVPWNGTWYFCLTDTVNGEWHQGNEFCVLAGASDEMADARLAEEKGMTNIWNMLFVIYERVDIDGFKNAFSDEDIDNIRKYADAIGYTLEELTDGRMRIGSVDTVQFSAPVTSASSGSMTSFRALTYGPGGDVNFNSLLEGKDINAVVVFAPLAGLPGTEDWLGLSPFFTGTGKTKCPVAIINWVEPRSEWVYYDIDGSYYPEELAAIVHELLHVIEYNSWNNGWSGFEPLHDLEKNGYQFVEGNYRWYRDLTRDQLKSGKRGFKPISFCIKHW